MSLILVPEPEFAPVIPPVIVPTVHEKLLEILAVKLILGPVPLQVADVAEFVTAGAGFTVTVIVKGEPSHKLVVEVGVTIYCTVPAVELPGLVSV
jgi:hypothetical protein